MRFASLALAILIATTLQPALARNWTDDEVLEAMRISYNAGYGDAGAMLSQELRIEYGEKITKMDRHLEIISAANEAIHIFNRLLEDNFNNSIVDKFSLADYSKL